LLFAQYGAKVSTRFNATSSQLAQNTNNKIVPLVEEKEIEVLDSISAPYQNVINMAGKIQSNKNYNLSVILMMLSMDSGNAHIAAML
jgi:UDP-3-O-acyl-N-acetylglucosamine deacetylase